MRSTDAFALACPIAVPTPAEIAAHGSEKIVIGTLHRQRQPGVERADRLVGLAPAWGGLFGMMLVQRWLIAQFSTLAF